MEASLIKNDIAQQKSAVTLTLIHAALSLLPVLIYYLKYINTRMLHLWWATSFF